MSESIIRKIEKLLALAASPNEAEASAAAEKAAQLMRLNGVSENQLGQESDEGGKSESLISASGKLARWRETLICGVAGLNGLGVLTCRSYCHDSRKMLSGFRLYGRKSAIIGAEITYNYLESTIDRLAKKRKGRGARYILSFRIGCASRLASRMMEMRRRMEAEGIHSKDGDCTALAVVDQYKRDQAIIDAMDALNGYTVNPDRPKLGIDGAGYLEGQQAGKGISLNSQIESGRELTPTLEG